MYSSAFSEVEGFELDLPDQFALVSRNAENKILAVVLVRHDLEIVSKDVVLKLVNNASTDMRVLICCNCNFFVKISYRR